MRPDQIERLKALEEKLVDCFLEEADPEEWPGAGVPLSDMTQQNRGDRYWCKKNAAATGVLAERVLHMQRDYMKTATDDTNGAHMRLLDREIAIAEKEAAKLVERIGANAKAKFDKRVHGKT